MMVWIWDGDCEVVFCAWWSLAWSVGGRVFGRLVSFGFHVGVFGC